MEDISAGEEKRTDREVYEEIEDLRDKITQGRGSPADLERLLEMGSAYWIGESQRWEQDRFPQVERNPNPARMAIRFQRALAEGMQGRLDFCVEQMRLILKDSRHSQVDLGNHFPTITAEKRQGAQEWAKLMASYQPTDIKSLD